MVKSKKLVVYFTIEDFNLVKYECQKCKRSISDYTRLLVLEKIKK